VLAARGRTRPGPLAKLPIGIGSALESRARRSNRLREYRMETWAVRDQAHPCQLAVLSAARLSVKRPSSGDLRSRLELRPVKASTFGWALCVK
jgi:hypothetical protein